MLIVCGVFSYGHFPALFNNIIGVTATLNKLSKYQKDLLEKEYDISEKSFTVMPSVFKNPSNNNNGSGNGNSNDAQSNLKFDKIADVKVVDDGMFKTRLVQEISKQRRDGCPIIIFFYDNSQLAEFARSRRFKQSKFGQKFRVLNEQCSHNEKQQIIRDACNLNAITLATRIFGRGTDFQVVDDQIESDLIGGPHVIQTFFSQEESEEIQIQGRTARYGGKGSYSMVLSKHIVEKRFGIRLGVVDVYQKLHEKRQQLQKDQFKNIINKIQAGKRQHEISEQVLNALKTKPVVPTNVADLLNMLQDEIGGAQRSSQWFFNIFG